MRLILYKVSKTFTSWVLQTQKTNFTLETEALTTDSFKQKVHYFHLLEQKSILPLEENISSMYLKTITFIEKQLFSAVP